MRVIIGAVVVAMKKAATRNATKWPLLSLPNSLKGYVTFVALVTFGVTITTPLAEFGPV